MPTNAHQKSKSQGTGEMAQPVRCLLCKNEDLGTHAKPSVMSLDPCVKMYPDTCKENRDSMASQSKQISELQAQ